MLGALSSHDGVLSLGGGAVTSAGVREALAGHTVIYLEVNVAEGVRRTGVNTGRPLLAGVDLAEKFRTLTMQRVPLYRQVATLRVDTNRRNPGAEVRYIVSRLENPQPNNPAARRGGSAWRRSTTSPADSCAAAGAGQSEPGPPTPPAARGGRDEPRPHGGGRRPLTSPRRCRHRQRWPSRAGENRTRNTTSEMWRTVHSTSVETWPSIELPSTRWRRPCAEVRAVSSLDRRGYPGTPERGPCRPGTQRIQRNQLPSIYPEQRCNRPDCLEQIVAARRDILLQRCFHLLEPSHGVINYRGDMELFRVVHSLFRAAFASATTVSIAPTRAVIPASAYGWISIRAVQELGCLCGTGNLDVRTVGPSNLCRGISHCDHLH